MDRPLIAIDIDDVLSESTEALRVLVNKRTGSSLEPAHYQVEGDYWEYYERVWSQHGLHGRVSHDNFSQEMAIDQLHVPLLPGAAYAVDRLTQKYEIVLITARDPSWEKATKVWLQHNLEAKLPRLHFVNNHNDSQAKTKGRVCKELGAQLLIDDNVDHCLSAIDEGVDAVLFGEYGWQYKAPPELTRCRDWPAVLEYLGVE